MIVPVAQRLFTAAEANAALETIRPVAEELVHHTGELRQAAEERAELIQAAGGNGGGTSVTRLPELTETIRREQAAIARCVSQLEAAGVQVKDLTTGLLDFPSERDGEEILLCWRLGEDGITHWHGLEEGFAGRKRLDPE